MHEMQSVLTNVCGICLSCGSYRLHCAKMAEQIKMLFGVNTPAGPRNIVLKVVLIPHSFEFWDPLLSPEWLKLET